MAILKPGHYRFDILILFCYQMCHFFSIQQVFPIFLKYAPKTRCKGDYCFKTPKMATHNFTCWEECTPAKCKDLCAGLVGANKTACVEEYQTSYYTSAGMEFDTTCQSHWSYAVFSFNPAFAQYFGVLIGNIVLGYVADRWGRRNTFIFSLVVGIPALALSGYSVNIEMLYALRALTGIGIAGTMIVGFTYFSELISPTQRFKLRTFSNWANARIMMTLVCLYAGEWRLSSYLCAAISCLTLAIAVFILPDSHIWLKKKGRFAEAEESRKRIAWLSGVEFEPQPPPVVKEGELPPEPEKSVTIKHVFQNPTLRRNLLVLWCMWFVIGMSVYLVDLSGGDMTKNFWIGQFLSGILLSVVRIILGFADGELPWMGRRVVLLGSQGLAVFFYIFIIVFLFLGQKGEWWYTCVYLGAFIFTSIVWEPCYLCASELMPTDVRATSTASCSIVGRIANIGASVFSVELKDKFEPGIHMISFVLGIMNMIVAFFWLEETKNCNLDKAGTGHAGAKATPIAKNDPAEMSLLKSATNEDENPYKDTVVSGSNPTSAN